MKSFFQTPEKRKKYVLIAGDLFAIALSLFLCFFLQIVLRGRIAAFFEPIVRLPLFPRIVALINLSLIFIGIWLLFGVIYISIYYIIGLYEIEIIYNKKKTLINLCTAVIFATLFLFAFLGIFSKRIFLIEIWIFHAILLFLFLFLWRLIFFGKITTGEPFHILVTEKDTLTDKAVSKFLTGRNMRFLHLTVCSEDDFLKGEIHPHNPIDKPYDMIVYPFTKKLSQDHLIELVKKKFEGIRVCSSLTFYKNSTGSFPVFELDAQWLIDLSISLALTKQLQQRIKRVIDIFFSFFGFVISLPIMFVIAFMIKFSSEGPVLYVNERLGLNRRPFMLYKFRTMIRDAEKDTGPVWATEYDPRVTNVGRFLRKTRLDELPQFYNVLKGDMSFIGPRPIRQFFADKLSEEFPYYFLRFYVKPGLTGWAQVSGDYGDTVEGQLKKLEYELFYIHEYSLLLDAVILLKTVQNVLKAKGQ